MKESSRLFNCALCHRLCNICSDCDRGNIYCSKLCSMKARTASLRESAKRYQSSFLGRMKHAKRQARYRQRQREQVLKTEKVTHQGYAASPSGVLLSTVPKLEKQRLSEVVVEEVRPCDICHQGKFHYFRSGFIRHHQDKSALISALWPCGP